MTDKIQPKQYKSNWFRVAVAGDTTDGREIQPEWIIQMAESYNPNTYGARVNVEHIRSAFPDSSFGAYGDVLAVKTEKVEIDGEQKDALFVQIKPNANLIELNKRGQKVYSSIEVDRNFAKTGKAYLVGLAVTDSPASLGTEMLQFASTAKVNPLADRKQNPDNIFTASQEVSLEFEEVKELVETFLQYNTNTVERGLFYQCMDVVLEVMLDDEMDIGDFEVNFRRMFGDERMDAVLGSVNGTVKFYGLTETNMQLDGLDRHLRLIDSYKKLHQARAKYVKN